MSDLGPGPTGAVVLFASSAAIITVVLYFIGTVQ